MKSRLASAILLLAAVTLLISGALVARSGGHPIGYRIPQDVSAPVSG